MKIIFIGSYSPFSLSASNEKNRLLAKALSEIGVSVLFINKFGNVKKQEHPDAEPSGTCYGFKYVYPNGSPFVIKNRFIRLLRTIPAFYGEFKILFRFASIKRKSIIISYCPFLLIFYYRLLSRIFHYKLIIHIMEYHISMIQISYLSKINAFFFDKYSFKCSDAAIVISHYLRDHVLRIKRQPIFLLPIITDLYDLPSLQKRNEIEYFAYCGSIGYKEVINLIIDSYYPFRNKLSLILILTGKLSEIKDFQIELEKRNLNKIVIKSNISYKELLSIYFNAVALLIPLRETLQDKARFPHKIGEYLMSSTPIITNNWGEIPYYFIHNENAFIAQKYDVQAFIDIYEAIIRWPDRARYVGSNGRKLAIKKFYYSNFSLPLKDFFEKLF